MQIKLPPVIEQLIRISRSELGPDSLPVSWPWLTASLLAYAFSLTIDRFLEYQPGKAVAIAVTATVILTLLAAGGLYLVGVGKRLPQTLTALAGAGAIITFVRFAVHSVIVLGLPAEIPVNELAGFLMFPLFLWNLVVFTAIFNAALSSGRFVGFAIALSYTLALAFWLPRFFK